MNNQNRVVLLAGIATAVIAGAVLAQPYLSALAARNYNATINTTSDNSNLTTFEEEAMKTGEENMTSSNAPSANATSANATSANATSANATSANATKSNETSVSQQTTMATIGDNNTVSLQGTASSPGDEAGPFQVIDLLPPRFDGKIYTGSVSFTATKPILVAPLHTYNVANETLDPDFGQLFVFQGVPNGTMVAPAITMPDYATQDDIDSNIPMPKTYSATVPFTGSGLSVGRLDGEKFLISYTLSATVSEAQSMDNVDSAIANQTQVEGTNATIVSGATFQNETAYSPNPIEIDRGDTVTWINKDFDGHTVTSGSPGDEDAGDDFDSGYMGPQNTFSHEFGQRGEFDYFCEIHPNMVGTVTVD